MPRPTRIWALPQVPLTRIESERTIPEEIRHLRLLHPRPRSWHRHRPHPLTCKPRHLRRPRSISDGPTQRTTRLGLRSNGARVRAVRTSYRSLRLARTLLCTRTSAGQQIRRTRIESGLITEQGIRVSPTLRPPRRRRHRLYLYSPSFAAASVRMVHLWRVRQ